jgi:inhibitor of KinA
VSGARIVPAGDAALIIEFDDRIDPAINARAVALAQALDGEAIAGVRDVVPTHRSVAVYFDPLHTNQTALVETLERLAERSAGVPAQRRDVIRIPVCYGGACGPDLARVAAFAGLSESAVVDLHAGALYRVLMLGFLPGFAYMGMVDARIAAPRLDTPRTRVPGGSVGIAGVQTGIYPRESPGGWQLIGRTPARPFDLARPDPVLFRAGDDVQFFPIAQTEFDDFDRAR